MQKKPDSNATLAMPKISASGKILLKKYKLLILSGPQQGKEVIIDKDTFTIGVGPNNDLSLQDATVSKQHCELQNAPEGFLIRDLGSTNGTIVQSMQVKEAIINQSTEVMLGETRILFCPMREATEYSISNSNSFGSLLGQSIPMRRVFYLAQKFAATDATVLIEGETGTGKEILAEELHKHSQRATAPFVVIDCSALANELIQSELFGHKKGSFTGATADRIGAFEHANGGTVFLDEIGDLNPELQPKLLRVLEKREIRRVGSNEVTPINVRIISATNRRLDNEVNAGRFREDLYYRLSVAHIEMPPLRRRTEDIPVLVSKFLKDFKREELLSDTHAMEKTMQALCSHNWPGNVRELRNLIEIASYSNHKTMDLSALLCLESIRDAEESSAAAVTADRPFKSAKNTLIDDFEKKYVATLLQKNKGNISATAREADIERTYLKRLIRKHSIETPTEE
jgi:DNA-binding NtrC family response regulator